MFEWTKYLDSIGSDMQRLQVLLKRAIEREADPGLREHMRGLDNLLTSSFDRVKETLPAAEAKLNQDLASIQDAIPGMEKNIADAQKAIDEAVQAAAAPQAVPAAVPFDPKLGLQLRDELLKRFAPSEAELAPVGEVAAMTSAEFKSDEPAPPPPPKAKTEPPRRKPKDTKSSDENWSLDS